VSEGRTARRIGTRAGATGRPARGGGVRGFLLTLLVVVSGMAAGIMIFDRIVMPRVVRHGNDVRVPAVAGRDLAQAEKTLRADGLQPVRAAGRYNSQIPGGDVLEVSPSVGLLVKRGRQVYLTPSLGPVNRRVPDINGLSTRMARVELSGVGLSIAHTDYVATDMVQPDQVLAVSPEPGTPVPPEGMVSLLVSRSRAPASFFLPDLRGLGGAECVSILQSSGLHAVLTDGPPTGAPGTVVSQDPQPGTPVWPGADISLSVARGSPVPLPGRGRG
jgi:beta-lactam-binding protein with PASTA domain